jgi:hypothetical protein
MDEAKMMVIILRQPHVPEQFMNRERIVHWWSSLVAWHSPGAVDPLHAS